MRLDAEVVGFFRASGPGWQTRMNEALAEYVSKQRRDAGSIPMGRICTSYGLPRDFASHAHNVRLDLSHNFTRPSIHTQTPRISE